MSDIIIIEFISDQKRGLQVTNYIVKWGGSVLKPVVCFNRQQRQSYVICHVTFETLKLEPYIVTTQPSAANVLCHLPCRKWEAINTHRTDVTENCGKSTNVNTE